MRLVTITDIPGFDVWREAARKHLLDQIPPSSIVWNKDAGGQGDFFAMPEGRVMKQRQPHVFFVSKDFMEMARAVCCHVDPEKYALLYRLLWRLKFENPYLLKILTDEDVMKAQGMVKAVRRDAYKITAFLRFREIRHQEQEYFVAWYEPEHYTLERVLPFFQTRFRNMRWSILTPYRAAHWDRQDMVLEDNPNPDLYPKEDEIEQYWLGYYSNIFNPARPKKSAMLNQMPKKYWKNMPETVLVPEMLRKAETRAREMIARSQPPQK